MTVEAPMRTSLEGMKFIVGREALVTVAHADGMHKSGPLAGQPKLSIGFGSQDPPPKEGDVISIDEAFERLQKNLDTRDETINKLLTVEVKQQEFDAVSSLFYQNGSASLKHVTSLFNEGKPIRAVWAFTEYPFGEDKVFSDGIAKRRAREMSMAFDGVYLDSEAFLYFDGQPRGPDKVAPRWMPFPDNLTR